MLFVTGCVVTFVLNRLNLAAFLFLFYGTVEILCHGFIANLYHKLWETGI